MNFRFTLHSELGAYVLEKDPIGWDKAEILFKRSPKYHGIFYEKNIDLTFYCGAGKEYIDDILDTLGIDTLITIKIEISCGSYVADRPDYSIDYSDDYGSKGGGVPVYEELYLGKLDLKTWSTVDNKSTVNIIQEGIADTVINRLDTVIDITKLETLDGTALTAFDFAPYDLNLHSKAIVLVSDFSSEEDLTDSGTFDTSIVTISNKIAINNILPINMAELDTVTEYDGLIAIADTFTSVFPDTLYTATETGTFTFDYLIQGQIRENNVNGRTYSMLYAYRVNSTGTTIHDFGSSHHPTGIATFNLNFTGSLSLNLNEGDTVSFFAYIKDFVEDFPNVGALSFVNHDLDATSYIKIKVQSLKPDTTAKAFAIFETGARIAQSITNQTDAFRSDYFGRVNAQPFASEANGCGSFAALTNGALIRNFPLEDQTVDDITTAGRPLRISLNQYFDSLNAIYNLGLGIEKASDIFYIRIEPKDYFYQDTLLFQLSNVPHIKLSVATEYYYSKVNIGYEQWQIEQTNGIDEFNSVRQYDTGLKVIDNTLEAKSNLIASGYILEIARRKQYPDSFTQDDAHDNDNFIVCLNRTETDGEPTGLDTAEKDENFDSVSNVLSPETSYNLRISPARNMLRWTPVTAVGLLKYPARSVKLTNGEGNFKMESEFTADVCPGNWNNNSFSEGQDIQIDSADNSDYSPLWEPIIATFNYPLTRTQAKLLQANPYGYIEVSERSTVYEKWYILEAKYIPVGGMTEFKLLKKWQ